MLSVVEERSPHPHSEDVARLITTLRSISLTIGVRLGQYNNMRSRDTLSFEWRKIRYIKVYSSQGIMYNINCRDGSFFILNATRDIATSTQIAKIFLEVWTWQKRTNFSAKFSLITSQGPAAIGNSDRSAKRSIFVN